MQRILFAFMVVTYIDMPTCISSRTWFSTRASYVVFLSTSAMNIKPSSQGHASVMKRPIVNRDDRLSESLPNCEMNDSLPKRNRSKASTFSRFSSFVDIEERPSTFAVHRRTTWKIAYRLAIRLRD